MQNLQKIRKDDYLKKKLNNKKSKAINVKPILENSYVQVNNFIKKGFFVHPDKINKNYMASKEGTIFNIITNKELKGSLNAGGYLVIKLNNKSVQKHKFIYE